MLFQNKTDRKDKITVNAHNPLPQSHILPSEFREPHTEENIQFLMPPLTQMCKKSMELAMVAQGLYLSWMEASPLLDFLPPPQVFGGQSIWEVW